MTIYAIFFIINTIMELIGVRIRQHRFIPLNIKYLNKNIYFIFLLKKNFKIKTISKIKKIRYFLFKMEILIS